MYCFWGLFVVVLTAHIFLNRFRSLHAAIPLGGCLHLGHLTWIAGNSVFERGSLFKSIISTTVSSVGFLRCEYLLHWRYC